jgi:hypothetical protein
MIQAQPDIVVARLLSTLATTQEMTAENSNETTPHLQKGRLPDTKDFTSDNIVTKHYRYWSSSPSWLIFLLGAFEYRSRRSTRRQIIEAKFQVPAWISNRVWDCRARGTLSGWRLNLQAYRVLAFEHPLFRCARSGDVTGLQDLLSRREISVTDRQIDAARRLDPNDHNHAGRQLIREIITAGADLRAISLKRQTPLCELVRDFTDAYSPKVFFFETLQNLLYNWLHDLQVARVDLERYGSVEKALHVGGLVETNFSFSKYSAYRGAFQLFFTYGSRPGNWTFRFSKQTDLFAAEFWAMIKRSTEPEHSDDDQLDEELDQSTNYHIPGSWINSAVY